MLFGFALAALVFGLAQDTRAQSAPKYEIFGGYSYVSDDIQRERLNLNGFEASVNRNITDWFGIEGNVAGHYGDHDHHSFMAGPKFTYQGKVVRPFVHVLAGVDVVGSADSAFTMAVGGGLDARVNDRISIRVVQVDYHPLFYGTTAHNVRVSAGVVFTF